MRGARAVVCGLCVLAGAADLAAQRPPARVELSGGVRVNGPARFGRADADETTPDGGSAPLFETRTELEASIAADGRVGFLITRALELEVSASYGQSNLSTRITSDEEGIPDVTVTEPVRQIAVEGSLVARVGRVEPRRLVPFVSVGGGYLRELHDRQTLAETGRLYHVGGGVEYAFAERPRGALRSMGLRAGARAVIRTGGTALDDKAIVVPAAGISVFFRF